MNTTCSLQTPREWAQQQFGFAQLGHVRRTKRLMNIGEKLAASPGGTLPQAFPEWSQVKATYRFFSNPQVNFEQITAPHYQLTRQRCSEPGEYLFIEDTTELNYTHHPATEDLGSVGDNQGRGFWLHSTLALQVEQWDLNHRPEAIAVGLLGQQCWTRPHRARGRRHTETWRQRMTRQRESQRWAAVLEELSVPPKGCRWIYMADREADFYEPMERCGRGGLDFILRAYRDRKLAEEPAHLKEVVAKAPVLGQLEIELRSRPGQPARTALVEVRACALRVQGPWRPGGQRPDMDLNGVQVLEINPPQGAEPLHWILLSSLECSTWNQVRRVVGRYCVRWWIEEYHKALKTGTGVEASQLERAYRLESLIGVMAVLAVRLVNAKWLARARPDEPVDPQVFGAVLLKLLALRVGKPKEGWTHQNTLVCVARVGGFLARKGDGMPGWQTIWRGWQRLMWMAEGAGLLN
jgi:transposase-like protein/transposase Tn5 family protein